MPLYVPPTVNVSETSLDDIAEEVWAYVTRRLTSLAIPTDIVKFVGKGTGTEVPDNKSLYDLIALDRLDHGTYGLSALNTDLDTLLARLTASRAVYLDYLNTILNAKVPLMELEQAYVADEVQATLNTTGAFVTLGSRNITVALPTGASRVRAIALALVHIANRTANAQDIDLLLNVAGTTIFNQSNVVSFPAVPGSSVVSIVQDCSTEVTGDGTYSIEAQAQISAAQDVTFTVEYLIFVQYRMS